MTMIGVPVLLLSWLLTYVATTELSAVESSKAAVGTGQAVVEAPAPEPFTQLDGAGFGMASGHGDGDTPPAATPVPGYAEDPTAAIGRLVGGRAVALNQAGAKVSTDGDPIEVRVAGIGVRPGDDLGTRAHLTSGRWPTGPTEVAVTNWGVARGLPSTGTVRIELAKKDIRTFTIVGTADAIADLRVYAAPILADLVRLPEGPAQGWLVTDRAPVGWPDIDRLNAHGIVVQSPTAAAQPRDTGEEVSDPNAAAGVMLVAAGSTGMLLLTVLLAGPAFAVSASRSRRSLALLATNGATPAQLRRPMLAQALLLGAATAIVGTALGTGAFALLRPWFAMHVDDRAAYGLRLSPIIAAVAAAAILSAVIAALVPSRSLGRLDVGRALAGREVSPKVRASHTALGLVLLAVGAGLCLTAGDPSGTQGASVGLVGGIIAVTVGALFVVPGVLALFGHLAPRLPVTMRMAARDTARQRARTAPTVAAVMAGAALLTGTLVAIQSDNLEQRTTYVPSAAHGVGYLNGADGLNAAQTDRALSAIRQAAPALVTVPMRTLVVAKGMQSWSAPPAGPVTEVLAGRQACTAEQTLAELDGAFRPAAHCVTLGTRFSLRGQVSVAPASGLAALLHLNAQQRAAVERGALVLADPATIPAEPRPASFDRARPASVSVENGTVRLWQITGTPTAEGGLTRTAPPRTTEVPALVLQWDQFALGLESDANTGAFMASEAVERHGWFTSVNASYRVIDPTGPISPEAEARVNSAFEADAPDGSYLQMGVERGFSRGDDTVPLLIVTGVIALIILVSTLSSTALSMSEQQAMMGTLAAVGATRMTRRKIAAGQAFMLAGLGALVGCAIGLPPGIAAARTVTMTFTDAVVVADGAAVQGTLGPFIDVPWAWLGWTVLGVTLTAAAFAFASIRRTPTVTRRLG